MKWARPAVVMALVLSACSPEQPASEPAGQSRSRLATSGPLPLQPLAVTTGDQLGSQVAVSGDRALVAMPFSDLPGPSDAGRVAVFQRVSGSPWTELTGLQASDAATNDRFGSALAFDGSTAIVGAPGKPAAYVFTKTSSGFAPQQKLVPLNAVGEGAFGSTAGVQLDTALVGAPAEEGWGAVYVFVRSGSSWAQQARLVAKDGFFGRRFGSSVLVRGELAFIGTDDQFPGAVYVYARSGTTWTEQAKLQPNAPAANDRFGAALGSLGAGLIVGAPGANSVFEFVASAGNWTQQAQLTTPPQSVQFGAALAADDDVVAVGDPLQTSNAGNAYLYQKLATGWSTPAPLGAPATDARSFGAAIALDVPSLVIGAPQHDMGFPQSLIGAAYRYVISNGTGCTSGSSCPSGHCVEGVCCDSACSDPCATCLVGFGAPEDGICGIRYKGNGVLACGFHACDGISVQCSTSCDSQDDCIGPSYCDTLTKKCEATKPNGASCSSEIECNSQVCVDGMCCNESCLSCRACRYVMTGEPDGTCADVFAGIDPYDTCPVDPGFPTSCLADGACDGDGKCRLFAPPTTPCGATTCFAQEVSGMLCDGSGNCQQGIEPCGTYPCAGSTCATSCANGGCDPSGYCSPGKTCEPRRPLGDHCTSGDQCLSAYCVDGYCCNGPCDGQCEWCADSESYGLCKQVVGNPPAGREPCPAGDPTDPCSILSCDGINGKLCAAPGMSTVCRAPSCSDGKMLTETRCDGSGSCPTKEPLTCGAYACGPTACKQSCAADDDCAAGNRCDVVSGKCSAETVCDGDHTLLSASGVPSDCSPFRCSGSACFTICSSAAQCIEGHICSSAGRCEPRGDGKESESCSCTLPGSSRARDFSAALVALLLASAFARRYSRSLPGNGTKSAT